MLTAAQVKLLGKAIIARYNRNEGTINEIIANCYPSLTEEQILQVKAYIVSERPDINVDA